MMENRGHLITEQRNPRSTQLDRLTTRAAFDLLNLEDATIAAAVAAARAPICQAVDWVVAALAAGGRLIYVGAGTSGRLGVLDAAECPPTFLSDPDRIQGVIAGGLEAMTRSVEGAEDHSKDGADAMDDRAVGPQDVVFAIATGGTTPFVHGAIRRARKRGAKTVFLACVPKEQVTDEADLSIRVITGPEVLTGSTRMKAGTATKMVLNAVTTLAMVQSGRVYENLMVAVNTRANAKLVDRGIRIIQEVTGLAREEARRLLESSHGEVKTAIVVHVAGLDPETARRRLEAAGGHIARVVAAPVPMK